MTRSPNWQHVYDVLEADILSGHRLPGARLVEDAVMAQAASTRHAVRRAFAALERDGLSILEPRKGMRVFNPQPDALSEIVEIRLCLERQAIARLPFPVSAGKLATLRQIAGRHRAASRDLDPVAAFRLDMLFHETLYRAAGSRQLVDAILRYARPGHAVHRAAFKDSGLREAEAAQHDAMINAIAVEDRDALRQLVDEHLHRPLSFFRDASRRGGKPV